MTEHAKCTYCESPRYPGHDLFICLSEMRERLLASETDRHTQRDQIAALERQLADQRDVAVTLRTEITKRDQVLAIVSRGLASGSAEGIADMIIELEVLKAGKEQTHGKIGG